MKKPLTKVEWIELISKESDEAEPIQIVDQEENVNGSIPDKNYRLSQSNRDVLQETRAEERGDFRNIKNKKGSSPESQNTQVKKQSQVSLDDLKPKLFEFKPFLDSDSSRSDDYLKDVDTGFQTFLRTREFAYYSYYSRIKRKLKFHWEPKLKVKIIRALGQGRRIAGVSDKITRLVITLNQSGELTRVRVKNTSGFDELDDAAIESFQEASPFPNPPKGLMNEFGEVQIHWDFVLET